MPRRESDLRAAAASKHKAAPEPAPAKPEPKASEAKPRTVRTSGPLTSSVGTIENPVAAARFAEAPVRAPEPDTTSKQPIERKTEVQRVYHLDRGYEMIEKKLKAVGAKIKRVKA